jgi:hypothetical protein
VPGQSSRRHRAGVRRRSFTAHFTRAVGYDLSRLVQTGSNFGTQHRHDSEPLIGELPAQLWEHTDPRDNPLTSTVTEREHGAQRAVPSVRSDEAASPIPCRRGRRGGYGGQVARLGR